MRMEYLRYLLEIDRRHSISAAAQALYLSQTTLSSTLKRIETELGFSIFSRMQGGVETTAEGDEALAIIEEILDKYQEIQQLGGQGTAASPVVLLLSPTISEALSIPLNQRFLEQNPDWNLEFHSVLGDKIGSQIINGESNIGITYYSADHFSEYCSIASKYGVKVTILYWDHLYLLVRRDHPLAERERVFAGELNDLNFAILPHFNTQEDSIAYAKHLGTGNRYTTFPSVALLKQAVVQNNMVTILSGYTIYHSVEKEDDQFRVVPLVGTENRNKIAMCLLHRSEQSISEQEKKLIQCVLDYFRELAPGSADQMTHGR